MLKSELGTIVDNLITNNEQNSMRSKDRLAFQSDRVGESKIAKAFYEFLVGERNSLPSTKYIVELLKNGYQYLSNGYGVGIYYIPPEIIVEFSRPAEIDPSSIEKLPTHERKGHSAEIVYIITAMSGQKPIIYTPFGHKGLAPEEKLLDEKRIRFLQSYLSKCQKNYSESEYLKWKKIYLEIKELVCEEEISSKKSL